MTDGRRIPCADHENLHHHDAEDDPHTPCADHVTAHENPRHHDVADDRRTPYEDHANLRRHDAGGENLLHGHRPGDPRPRVCEDQKKDGQDGHPWVRHHVKRGAENEGGRLT